MTSMGCKMEKIKKITLLILAGFLASTGLEAAAPPALQTPEEVMWKKVSQTVDADLASEPTLSVMNEFFKRYSDHPKATLLRYIYAERDFRAEQYQNAAVEYEKFLR